MKFTEETLEKIDKAYFKARREKQRKWGTLGITVANSNWLGCAGVFSNGNPICEIDELTQMIEELTMMRDVIAKEIGIEV